MSICRERLRNNLNCLESSAGSCMSFVHHILWCRQNAVAGMDPTFLLMLITDYCWRSWTCRIAAPYKSHVDWLIDWLIGLAASRMYEGDWPVCVVCIRRADLMLWQCWLSIVNGICNAHDILTRNWYQKTGTSFLYMCHAIWYQFLSGARFWYQIEHVLFSARIW